MSYTTKVVGQPRFDQQGKVIIRQIPNTNTKVIDLFCGEDYRNKETKLYVSVFFTFVNDKLKNLKKGDRLLVTGKLGTSKSNKGVHGITLTPDNNQFFVLDKEVSADYGITPGNDEGYINGAFLTKSGHVNLLIKRKLYKPFYKKVSDGDAPLFEKNNWYDQSDFTVTVNKTSYIMRNIIRLIEKNKGAKVEEITQSDLDSLKGYYVFVELNKNPMFSSKETPVDDKKFTSLFINLWAERVDFINQYKKSEAIPAAQVADKTANTANATAPMQQEPAPAPVENSPQVTSAPLPDRVASIGF